MALDTGTVFVTAADTPLVAAPGAGLYTNVLSLKFSNADVAAHVVVLEWGTTEFDRITVPGGGTNGVSYGPDKHGAIGKVSPSANQALQAKSLDAPGASALGVIAFYGRVG